MMGFARFAVVLCVALEVTGATGAASVRVFPDRTVAEVPRTIYGTGMEDANHEIYGGLDAQRLYNESFEEACGHGEIAIDDVYLKDEPTNRFGEMRCREDIVDGFRREELTFLRWGGSMVNAPEYLLKNMKGDRRPYTGFWFRTSSMGFCVPEFVKMSEALGLPCAFSIHAYDSTEDAVAFAMALKGVRVPLYVEIGNEECSGYTPAAGGPTSAQVRLYGAAVRRLVPAMRAANPKSRMKAAIFEENGKDHGLRRALAHARILEFVSDLAVR